MNAHLTQTPDLITIDLSGLPNASAIAFALVTGKTDAGYQWRYPAPPNEPIIVNGMRLTMQNFPNNPNTSYEVQVMAGGENFTANTDAPTPQGIHVTQEQKDAFLEAAPRLRSNALAAADQVDKTIALMVVTPLTDVNVELNALLNGAANMDDLRAIMERLASK